jgi:hypothetical protein
VLFSCQQQGELKVEHQGHIQGYEIHHQETFVSPFSPTKQSSNEMRCDIKFLRCVVHFKTKLNMPSRVDDEKRDELKRKSMRQVRVEVKPIVRILININESLTSEN